MKSTSLSALLLLFRSASAFKISPIIQKYSLSTSSLSLHARNSESPETAAADFAVTPSIDNSPSNNATRRPVITFVTGNLLKLKEAQHILDSTCSVPFELVAYGQLDLDELQSDIPEKIAAAKCRLAAKAVGGPVMIDDTSLCFNALGGLPGPYIKWSYLENNLCGSFETSMMLSSLLHALQLSSNKSSSLAGSWIALGAVAW